MKSKLFILSCLVTVVSGLSFVGAEAKTMCCPPKDKCAPKADKCAPQAQCVPKDKCSGCPDGLVETHKWWKV
ncbi:MAG: hypothetical protein SFU25_06250 [Candidatus Caenarcaniphilales bacterium]|nr:hypothetical protein [Candidatus Caenarcaniphilales bacterium]